MPTCKSNVGNLMQHWTLCNLVRIAMDRCIPGPNFIDAHAMAPLAGIVGPDGRFCRVQTRVQINHGPDHEWASTYERAWHQLALIDSYPNSANFVKQVWTGKFSMLLCEKDSSTIEELGPWCGQMNDLPRCANAEVFPGDWRKRFEQPRGIPRPDDVGLPQDSLTLVSFDPYRYDPTRNFDDGKNIDGGNLYPDDIVRLLNAIRNVASPVIIQLSTYSNDRGRAPQGVVIREIDKALTTQDFAGVVVPALNTENRHHQGMMSLVYARRLSNEWVEVLRGLPGRFTDWAQAIPD